MMEQVLRRRLAGDEAMPDLLIIDGGKGQLNVCTRVLPRASGWAPSPWWPWPSPGARRTAGFFFPRQEGRRLPP